MGKWLSRKMRYEELSASIEEHLAEKIDELMEHGMSREEATYAARRAFGNATHIDEQGREVWQWARLESIWADVKFALRQLAKSPAFTATAVLTLALGIGANTGIFTLTHSLLMKSLPVADPGRLVRISIDLNHPPQEAHNLQLNEFLIESLRRHATTVYGLFGWNQAFLVLQEDTGLRIHEGALVSGDTFEVLGLRPALGRLLRADDDRDGGGPDGWAAVLSYRFWREHFVGDPSVVGRHVTLSGHSVTIVGVAPQGFEGVIITVRPDFYLPLHYDPVMRGAQSLLGQRGNLWLTTFARLRPGVSLAAATSELQALFRPAINETLPAAVRHAPVVEHATFAVSDGGRGWSSLRNEYTRPLFLLQILVSVVLLVCCVNLAGLFMARTATREHEFAVRVALGAARARIMQQVLVESLLVALMGGSLAIAFSWATDRYLLRFLTDREAAQALSTSPDATILAFTGIAAVCCALFFGLAPAWIASHFPLDTALRTSGKNQGQGSPGSLRARRIFLPAQLALTLGLVAVAAMLSATVMHLRGNLPGFRPQHVLLFHTDFELLPQKGADLVLLYRRIVARIQQMPGVESASVAENTPLSGRSDLGSFTGDTPSAANTNTFSAEQNEIGSAYFATLGTPLMAGRDFGGNDADMGTCILNQAAARTLFPAGSALGRTVRQHISSMNTGASSSNACRVIGIVEDTRCVSLRDEPPPLVYLPVRAETERLTRMVLVVRARNTSLATAAYHNALRELAPKSPEMDPIPLSRQFDDSIARESLLSALSGFFAGLALLLSGIGVYGLTTSWVARRTSEIGVRMALGATQGGIVLLVLRQVALLLVMGIAAGGALAFFAGRAIRTFLYEVNPASPALLAMAVASLLVAAGIATLLPARRAASVDPMEALRAE